MLTYKDIDTNNAILSITDDVDEPRFIDILQKCNPTLGTKIKIDITIENDENSDNNIQFNRTVKEINQRLKEVDTNKGNVIIAEVDFILK